MISECTGQVHFIPVAATGNSGSSAMPHLGHAPGRACRTSGSIGQMYAGVVPRAFGGATDGVLSGAKVIAGLFSPLPDASAIGTGFAPSCTIAPIPPGL